MSKTRKDTSLSVRLTEQLFDHLQEVAEETDTSMAYHMRRALEIYFDESYVDAEMVALQEESEASEEYIDGNEARSILGLEKETESPAYDISTLRLFFQEVNRAIKVVSSQYHVSPLTSHETGKILKAGTKSTRRLSKKGQETRLSNTG